MTIYIDKGNEGQIINYLDSIGYSGISFDGRRDHLDWRKIYSI